MVCVCVSDIYDGPAVLLLLQRALGSPTFPHPRPTATRMYRIVGIPERARPNSSKVDTRPLVASASSSSSATSSRPPPRARPVPSVRPPPLTVGRRRRRLRRMGNRKTNPLGQIPVPGFCARVWPQSLPAARESRVVVVRVRVRVR